MKAIDVQSIGTELAIRWDDQTESYIRLEALRRGCPCAGCQGEKDVFGNLYQAPAKPYAERAFELARFQAVGGYAIQPVWGDGHATGIYSWDYLRRMADREKAP